MAEMRVSIVFADAEPIKQALENASRVIDAADELARGVEAFINARPFVAPEAMGLHVQRSLAEPLAAFRKAAHGV